MKKKIYPFCILAICFAITNNLNAQSANTNLSNLISPTKVNVALLPDKDNKRDLGNTNKAWRNLYLDTAIYIEGHRFVAARIGIGPGNTAVGTEALNANTNGSDNTAIGYNAMYSNTTGNQNTGVGLNALFFNTTGYYNTATGLNALYRNTTGVSNTAMGINSLSVNTTGAYNAAFGTQALYSNTTASYNTALGSFALYYNTANGNTAVGYNTLSYNTTGYSNVALGYAALKNNTTGHNIVAIGDSALFHQSANSDGDRENIAVGSKALYSNTTGYSNTAIGWNALYSNTNGTDNTANGDFALYSNISGNYNTAYGHNALYSNTSNNNTAYGWSALYFNTSGYHNVAIGSEALGTSTTGHWNTALGVSAGVSVTDGTSNTFVGYGADCGSGGHLTNSTAIGNLASVTANNIVRIGNSSVTSIGGFANWTNISDGRAKKNIRQNVPGLEFINKLQPVTYNLDLDKADKIMALPERKDKDGKIIQPSQSDVESRKAKEQIVYTGFIAQDVEKAANSLNYDFSGVDKPDNANTLYGLRYSDFVVPLVKAVQELDDSLEKSNASLQQQINELKKALQLLAGKNGISLSADNISISNASLSQNIPNPFSNTTTINYSLPQAYSSAKIIITDKNGIVLKEVNLSGIKGSVNVDASTLSSGAYQYSLFVDGRLIDTKQMILAK